MLARALQHTGHDRDCHQPGRLHRDHHVWQPFGPRVFHCGKANQAAHQLLHRVIGGDRRADRHGVHAVLHGLRAGRVLARRVGAHPVRPLALGGLHSVLGLPVHSVAHYCGPVLLRENSG